MEKFLKARSKQKKPALLQSSPTWKAKTIPFLNRLPIFFIPVFRYLLAVIYIWFVGAAVSSKYSVFEQPNITELNRYLASFKHLLMMQSLALCTVCLLWAYATQWMRRLMPWGLFIISMDVVVDVILQFLHSPFYHWVQQAELLLSGLALWVIPATGFVVFKYLDKLWHI
jgi:hypothetical protein